MKVTSKPKGMKRVGNLYDIVCNVLNLIEADKRAQKGKKKQYGVIKYNMQRGCNTISLLNLLANEWYSTSTYHNFTIEDPKVREISALPYFPDRIGQHAAMIPLEPIFVSTFTADTYSCIKGRGVGGAFRSVKKVLRDIEGTEFCLKMDITKFYPSINHDILKQLLRRKIKDERLLRLLDEIIDSAPGVPIGNYLSQYFANFYLTYFDHWLKEVKKVKYYFRYADDLVLFSGDIKYLHQLRVEITQYLQEFLKLEIKGNYQVFPVEARGVDFLGYVFRHKYVLLRKRNKKNFARAVKKGKSRSVIAGHMSLAKHCNSRHLLKTLLPETYDNYHRKAA